MSKYFSNAKEKMNNEKIEIKTDGIKVNSEKKAMYFLLVVEPLSSISLFKELVISLTMN